MRDPNFCPPMARVAPRDGPGEFPAPDFNMLRQIDTPRTTPHAPGARRGRQKCEKTPKMPPKCIDFTSIFAPNRPWNRVSWRRCGSCGVPRRLTNVVRPWRHRRTLASVIQRDFRGRKHTGRWKSADRVLAITFYSGLRFWNFLAHRHHRSVISTLGTEFTSGSRIRMGAQI